VHLGNGEWTVVDQNGRRMADRPLTREEADDLMNGSVPEQEQEQIGEPLEGAKNLAEG
jgi:hypothetical protein